MPSASCSSLWGQFYDLGFLQLVRSSFSNIMCPTNEASRLPEYTERPGYSINGFPLPWWHGHILRWQCQDSNCERVVQRAWDIHFQTWIGHHSIQTLTPLRIFGVCWRRLCAGVWLFHHQYKILVKKCVTFFFFGWRLFFGQAKYIYTFRNPFIVPTPTPTPPHTHFYLIQLNVVALKRPILKH